MIIYRDIITGDELFSDVYPIKEHGEGSFYKVTGKNVTQSSGGIDESLIGGNKSAEAEGDDDVDDSATESGINIVLQNRLSQAPPFDKKSFTTYMKGFCKTVVEKMKENEIPQAKIDEFKSKAPVGMKLIAKDVKNYDCYTGESMNPEGSIGFLNYEEDGVTPYMLFFKHGCIEEKV